MLDFFDEDFPLTKKQEEMLKALEAAKKAALAEAPDPAENNPLPVNTPPVAAEETVTAEQTAQVYAEAAPNVASEPIVETASEVAAEPVTEAAPVVAAETVAETAQEIAAEPIVETVPEVAAESAVEVTPEVVAETVAETSPEIAAEPIVETASEVIAEPVAEAAPEAAEPTADSFHEAAVETAAESVAAAEPVEEAAEPVFEAEPVEQILPEAVYEAAQDTLPSTAAEQTVEAAPEYVSEPVYETISEPVQEEVSPTVSEPEAVQSDKEDEDAAIKRIFQPIHEENDLPESDNQAFSYEYDGRYFAEEETPAYRYGASASPRRRTRPARSAEAKDGSITVSTKTLLKVGAVVAATAAAVKLLSKKD